MRRYLTGIGCFTRKRYALVGEWICPLCESADIEMRIGEPKPFCDGDSVTWENAYDMRCRACGHLASGALFHTATIDLPADQPEPDHDALQSDPDIGRQLQDRRKGRTIFLSSP